MQHIYISNHTEKLSRELAAVIKTLHSSPFIPMRFIVPHAGMESWLKFQISDLNGVFSNFLFQGLDDILTDIWQLTGNKGYAASRLKLKFKLHLLLNNEDFKTQFPDIATYYTDDDCRRLQLAEKIADLLDQYQVYRPELIEKWNQQPLADHQTAETWQCYLWHQLMQDKELVLKTDVRRQVLEEMNKQEIQDKIKNVYPHLIFFAQSHFPDFYWELIQKLDGFIDIRIFAVLPNKDEHYTHPLLLDWGKQAQELRGRLYADNSQPVEKFIDTNIQPGSLLFDLQLQLYSNQCPQNLCFTKEQQQDRSIEINGCYTRVREVESLYNYLLDLLENNNNLQLDDILVVAPDMDQYAPFVEGVFNNAPKAIPFHLAGIPKPADHSVLATLRDIMEFSAEHFTSEKVIGLLEKKRIRQFFGIEDTDYVRAQVTKANIRFGWENEIENDTVYVGWKYNLDRIISGYLMLTDEEYDMADNLTGIPFQDAEASAAADLIHLVDYVETLHTQLEARKETRTLPDWSNFLFTEIVDKMIATDYADKEELALLHKKIGFLEQTMQHYPEKISFEVFLEAIRSLLFAEMQTTSFRPGSVRFTSVSLARAIPKKVIALLGMNQKEFPRRDNFAGFDLIGKEYHAWDRRKRENDKSLFLDLLINTESSFYVSYLGMDVKDNTELPASIVVDQLANFINSKSVLAPDEKEGYVRVMHPLHGFSNRYGLQNPRLFTYLYGNHSGKEFGIASSEVPPIQTIDIKDLIKFFDSPIEWFYKRVLGIYFEENDLTLPETEVFDLGNLEQWNLKKLLLDLNNPQDDTLSLNLVKKGKLALGALGKLQLKENREMVQTLIEARNELACCKEAASSEPVDLVFDIEGQPVHLKGTIDGVYDDTFVFLSLSDVEKPKYKTQFMIQHLALSAQDKAATSYALGIDKGGNPKEYSMPADVSATDKLTELLKIFLQGNKELFVYHPLSEVKEILTDLNDWQNKLKKQFTPGDYNFNSSDYGIHLLREEQELQLNDEQRKAINWLYSNLDLLKESPGPKKRN